LIFLLEAAAMKGFKSVLEDIEDSSYDNEEEGEITDDESEQDFEREAYYSSENEEDGMEDSNEEVSLESDCTKFQRIYRRIQYFFLPCKILVKILFRWRFLLLRMVMSCKYLLLFQEIWYVLMNVYIFKKIQRRF
jgi:hypothetical protein